LINTARLALVHGNADAIARRIATLDERHRVWDLSMIPKKPAPDLIRGGYRFSEKIMLRQEAKAE
jgi:hypothetical protein